jgi:TRAP-type C4-dicarboxylate transport system permease large subunit
VFQTLFGGIRGGPAIVTALLCAFFTTFTGASGVTILALAGLLMPILIAAKYSEKAALGLLTGSRLARPPLPAVPSDDPLRDRREREDRGDLPRRDPARMPARRPDRVVGRPPGAEDRRRRAEGRLGRSRTRDVAAKWELLLPVVAMVALFGGFATPVEASAVTALYAFVVETFVYRDLSIRRGVPKVLAECGLVIGGVLMILGVAKGSRAT